MAVTLLITGGVGAIIKFKRRKLKSVERKCYRIELQPGQRFGSWTILYKDIEQSEIKKYTFYVCQCDCGKIQSVRASRLTNGYTTNCKECGNKKLSQTVCGKNHYDLTNEYGIGWTTNTNKPFYFDLEDYDRIKDYTWRENPTTGYVTTQSHKSNVDLHRFIMCAEKGEIVDHIHGNESKNDYRKSNLRIVSKAQNNINVGLRKHNKSGVTGVWWQPRLNKWQAKIGYQGKSIALGCYANFEDAVNARRAAEQKYYGDYSYEASQKL